MWLNAQPRQDLPLPTWQRGYRVHGYWLDGQRMGHVLVIAVRDGSIGYFWAIDAAQDRPEFLDACGEARTLRAAKRRVEAAFRRLYSWRFPASRGY